MQILNVNESLHSCIFIFRTFVDVRLPPLKFLGVGVAMAKDRERRDLSPVHLQALSISARAPRQEASFGLFAFRRQLERRRFQRASERLLVETISAELAC